MSDVPVKIFRSRKTLIGVSPSIPSGVEGEPLPPVNPPGSNPNGGTRTHNDLQGIQGGIEGERYHLTEAEKDDIVTISGDQTITAKKIFNADLIVGDPDLDYLEWDNTSNTFSVFSQTQFLHKFRGGAAGSLSMGQVDVDGNASINNTSNAGLTLGTNNTARIEIDADGNVGIGTVSPTEKLDINGKLRIRGNVNGIGNFVTISAMKVLQERTAIQSAFELSNIGKGVSTSEGFFTPTKISNYSVAFNIFRNTTYTFLASYYEIRRILEINLSGDCFVPTGVTLTISLKIGANIYASCTIIGGGANFWNMKYILSVSSTTEVKVSGVLNANTGNSIAVENINENFSTEKDISIEGIFSSSDADNAIRSNQIFVRLN